MRKKDDPIELVKERILSNDWATTEELEGYVKEARDYVDECVEFMENSPYPELDKVYEYVYEQEDYPFLNQYENGK